MNDATGYRFGIPVLSVGTLGSAAFLGFVAFRSGGSPVYLEPIPSCIFFGGPRMGMPADLVMNCPDDFRLALMTLLGLSLALALTISARRFAFDKTPESKRALPATRIASASITVGIGFLIGVYVSEFFGGKGQLNLTYLLGLPVLVTLMHFPRRTGFLIAVPVAVLGFVSLIVICFLTGVPLD